MLREYKYKDYYHPNTTPQEDLHLDVHADHCLEMLRASAMCHGDGSITTFQWSPVSPKPMLDLNRPSHQCINWDTLKESLKDRVVRVQELSELVNPLLELS